MSRGRAFGRADNDRARRISGSSSSRSVAGLRAYSVGGRDVVNGYGVDEMATAGRGQVLIPWPNRLQDGRYEFEGREHQLPLNEPEHANAIHGLVRWSAWSVADREADRVVMAHRLHPQPGYPFALGSEHRVRALRRRSLGADDGDERRRRSLSVRVRCAPVPQRRHRDRSTPSVCTCRQRTVLQADDRGIPTGATPVDGTDYDFRRAASRRRHEARPRLHRSRARRGRPRQGRAHEPRQRGRPDAVGRRELPVPDGVHGRPAGRRASRPRRRAHDLPAERVPERRRASIVLEPGGSVTSTWGISPTMR